MAQIYNSLKDLICPQMIAKSTRILGEKESNVSTASTSIIASLLGVMLKKGDTPQIRNILDEAGNLDILADVGNICQEKPTEEQRKIGDDFLQHLLGDKAADFTNPISSHTGVPKVVVNRMVSMIAPMVAGYLGKQLKRNNGNFQQLLRQIEEERNVFTPYIPTSLIETFGLGGALNTRTTQTVAEDKPKNRSWLTWLILIVLILLLFLWWRSCRNTPNDAYRTETAAAYRDTVTNSRVAPTATPITPASTTRTADNRDTTQMKLSNGQSITVYRGGIEEEMVNYLNSNEYRNASADDLSNKWFQFDNIAFEFNSSTNLMEHSQAQLNNIISILKSYPNARIRIAGFADNRGTEDVNMEISKERAKTIERIFEERGVGSQVVRTEGFGDEYATRPANAPDSLRAKDRDIALRFVK